MSVISSAAESAGGGADSSEATSAHSGRSDDRSTDPFTNDLPIPDIDITKLMALFALADILRNWMSADDSSGLIGVATGAY